MRDVAIEKSIPVRNSPPNNTLDGSHNSGESHPSNGSAAPAALAAKGHPKRANRTPMYLRDYMSRAYTHYVQ